MTHLFGPARGRRFVSARVIQPLTEFVDTEALGGIALLFAAALAIAWANSPWDGGYVALWDARLSADLGRLHFDEPLREAVNEGLMTIFFFVAGLEIKRELVHGELSSRRKAILPAAAAFGGMLVPAGIYLAFNLGGAGEHGWGIPMATDIAFALGALALLGRRAPLALRAFLLALAIVDDMGAILVIALFYTDSISLAAVAWAVGLGLLVVGMGRAGIQRTWLYVLPGCLFWLAVFETGVHATIAGVVLAMLTPSGAAGPRVPVDVPVPFEPAESSAPGHGSPLDRLEHALHPWVSFVVVPIFALANAGIVLSGGLISDAAGSPITWGVALGLLLGKPLGILSASYAVVRFGIGELPLNVTFSHVLGMALVAGIGFTVSLFITGLAFSNGTLVDEGKIGIVAGSVAAGVIGFVYLWFVPGERASG
jgi:NhaA family Na+:H+ antiporter